MRVLITEPIVSTAIETLREHFDVDIGERGEYTDEKSLQSAIPEYHALLTMLSNPVTEGVLKAGKNLKIVANYAVGYNNIDTQAAQKLDIHISNTPDVLTESTAEIALALMLATARKTVEAEQYLRNNNFHGWEPKGFMGLELDGAVLGIIGMGRIGRAFAKRANACGLKILYHNRNRVNPKVEKSLGATYVPDLDNMLTEVDVLSLHCPLTEQTHHLLDKSKLKLLREHAILVNTARGPIVDESALAEMLHNRRLGGAGLDVYENEPDVHPDLLTAPNTVLLPHIGSATKKSREAMGDLAANAIISILNGEPKSSIPNLVV